MALSRQEIADAVDALLRTGATPTNEDWSNIIESLYNFCDDDGRDLLADPVTQALWESMYVDLPEKTAHPCNPADLRNSLVDLINKGHDEFWDYSTVAGMTVATVSDLRELDVTRYNLARTLGYYAAGDGGNSIYYWNATDTTADDGGAVILPTGWASAGRWNLLPVNGCADIRAWGAADGADSADEINAAWAWCAANGVECYIAGEDYRVQKQLNIVDNLTVRMDPAGTLVRNFGTYGNFEPLISHETWSTTKISNVTLVDIHCGNIDNLQAGIIFRIYGDNNKIIRPVIDYLYGGQGFIVGGDNLIIDHPNIKGSENAAGTGGVRFIGGTDFVCVGGNVISGDDCFQFVPIAASGSDPNKDLDISRGRYVGCNGRSYFARPFVATTATADTATITDCAFIGGWGMGPRSGGIFIREANSNNQIKRILVQDILLEGDSGGALDQYSVYVLGSEFVTIRDVLVNTPAQRILELDTVDSVYIENLVQYDSSTVAGNKVRFLNTNTNVTLKNCRFLGDTGFDVIYQSSGSLTNLLISECVINDIADGYHGVRLAVTSASGTISGCKFNEVNGGTNAFLVRIDAGSDNIIESCDFRGITSGNRITNVPSDTVIRDNDGIPLLVPTVSVGASPFTHTCGSLRETVGIRGGTVSQVTLTKRDGIAGTNVASTTDVVVDLDPGDTLTVTYSSVPVMVAIERA